MPHCPAPFSSESLAFRIVQQKRNRRQLWERHVSSILKYFSTLPFFVSLIVLLSIKQVQKILHKYMHVFFRLMETHTNNGILNSSHCMGLTQTQKLMPPVLEMTPLGLVIMFQLPPLKKDRGSRKITVWLGTVN